MKTSAKFLRSERGSTQRWLALGAALAITLGGGALYGSYSQRWGPPADLSAAAAQLEQLPRQLGKWTLAEDLPFDKATQEMLECAGYVNRRYVNQETGQGVTLAMIVGPAGPTSVHTPEICYSSRAYEQQGERQRIEMGASPVNRDSFWALDFTTRNVLADGLRVYYGWSRGKTWDATASPRFEFAAAPFLYKLQLAAPISARLGEDAPDVGREFLAEFLRSGWPQAAPAPPNRDASKQ